MTPLQAYADAIHAWQTAHEDHERAVQRGSPAAVEAAFGRLEAAQAALDAARRAARRAR